MKLQFSTSLKQIMNQNQLRDSARKVQDYLAGHGFDMKVTELTESTRTAAEAAESVGCSIGQIAKSLIFKDKNTKDPVLVIASGANMVDTKKLKRQTGISCGKADGTWVKEKVGFAIGGIPPVGHLKQLQTFLDPELKKYSRIWAAAGTPFALFELTPDKLEELTRGTWIPMAQEK